MKTSKYFIRNLIFFLLIVTSGCKKDPPKTLPKISTTEISNITSISASSGGTITDDGNSPVTSRGVCWSINGNPTISDNKTSDGSGVGVFSSSITELLPGKLYYVRAYAINAVGTAYGNQLSITTTTVLPTITTNDITEVTSSSAISGGNITDDGGALVTARGVCWGNTQTPTIKDSITYNGSGIGIFSSLLTKLAPGTTYFVRAFAINEVGVTYGNQLTFSSIAVIPTLTTSTITEITPESAICGGTVTSDGGNEVIARGICWSINKNPTVKDSITIDELNTSTFSSNLTDLLENTTYYVRAYATNNVGTGYGNVQTFTTSKRTIESDYKPLGLEFEPLEVLLTIPTDESYIPQTVVTKSFELETELNVPEPGWQAGGSCVGWAVGYGLMSFLFNSLEGYEDYDGYDKVFSPYYIWNQIRLDINKNDGIWISSALNLVVNQGCCKLSDMPINESYFTSLPTLTARNNASKYKLTSFMRCSFNLNKLKSYIAFDDIPIVIGLNVDKAFQKDGDSQFEKRNGKLVWTNYNDNSREGHAVLICGFDDNINAFKVLNSWSSNWGQNGYFWLDYEFAKKAINSILGIHYSIFVAHVKRPKVYTNTVSNITGSSATCGGSITRTWDLSITERGIAWSTTANPTISDNKVVAYTGQNVFNCILTGLSKGTKYYAKAYAINSEGISYGKQLSFMTTSLQLPIVSTASVNTFTSTTAVMGGNVTSDGGANVTERGVVYSTTQNPTTSNTKVPSGSGTGAYAVNVSGLSANTTYYVRAYAINSQGTAYGTQISFKTGQALSPATVTTNAATNITTTGVTLGGNITSDGNATVTERGVVYSTTQNPTTSNTKVPSGSGTGAYAVNVSGLSSNTTYYVRAYAINSQGTAYGTQVSFTTGQALSLASVITSAASNITTTGATMGGNVTSDGNATVTEKGVVYSTTQNPTTSNTKVSSGSGTGTYSVNATNLTANTTYYVRAYAVNSQGTAYGSEVSFTTASSSGIIFNPNLIYGSVTDIDGNVYKTIQIGTQVWMAENLKVTKYNNGDVIPTTKKLNEFNSPYKYQWPCNMDENELFVYGRLYTGYVLQDTRNVCPNGWHVPTVEEWQTLGYFVGGIYESSGGNGMIGAGAHLKEVGTLHWVEPNSDATNKYGLTALPGGWIYSLNSEQKGLYGSYFTSTTSYWNGHKHHVDFRNDSGILRVPIPAYTQGHNDLVARSIRCVKD